MIIFIHIQQYLLGIFEKIIHIYKLGNNCKRTQYIIGTLN